MGKMGLLHSAILNSLDDSNVAAVVEPDRTISSFLNRFSNIPVYQNHREMLKKDLDAVYITTPVHFHAAMAEDCADSNTPFFVEKPLGLDTKECSHLPAVTDHLCTMVGYHLRYSDTFLEAKRLLDGKAIGTVTSVNASVFQSQMLQRASGWRFDKRTGGGVLMDLGTHLVDLVMWYFGGITHARGTMDFIQGASVEDGVSAELVLDDGTRCAFEASWNVKNYRLQETVLEIAGESGTMTVNEDRVTVSQDGVKNTVYRQHLGHGVPIDVGGTEYTAEDVDFVECIRSGRHPKVDVAWALRVQRVVDGIYDAARQDTVTEIKDA